MAGFGLFMAVVSKEAKILHGAKRIFHSERVDFS